MPQEYDLEWTVTSVAAIVRLCSKRGRILALMQDNPDPDGIASALAFGRLIHERLGKRVVIGYGGTVGRAENQAMLDLLRIDARRVTFEDLRDYEAICLIDTQPLSGNNVIVTHWPVDIVIDHHYMAASGKPWKAAVADIRPHYGATSTILYEYLMAARVAVSQDLATALFYGIQSDTQELGREASPADVAAFQALFQMADKKMLARIRRAPVPAAYFRMLHDSLSDTVVAGSTVVSAIRSSCHPEMVAEVAELMLRLRGSRTSVCYGVCGNLIHLSVRTADFRGNAAQRIRMVVKDIGAGGGHRMMAGGQVPLGDDPAATIALVRKRILDVFAHRKTPHPLLAQD